MATYSTTFAWARRLKAAQYRQRVRQTRFVVALCLYYQARS